VKQDPGRKAGTRNATGRRGFLAGLAATAIEATGSAAQTAASTQRVHGANGVLQVGLIGLGNISRGHLKGLMSREDQVRIVAVCDIYKPRLEAGARLTKARAYNDYKDLLADPNVDVVFVLTPDHWHARMAIDAMRAGKDVDVEKPMSLTIEEAREMVRVSRETGRILAVDSEHTAHGIWKPAKAAIQGGVLGKLLWSQTSRSRNALEPPWNYTIEKDATPQNIDWEKFLGNTPKRPFDPERFFRWRRYWDYSGGIATDLYVHHLAPLIKITGPEFPSRVVSAGGSWLVPKDVMEVPETFIMAIDYPSKHTILAGGSLANSAELPIVVRGHAANMRFFGSQLRPDYLLIEPEHPYIDKVREKIRRGGFEGRWVPWDGQGTERKGASEAFRVDSPPSESFLENFLRCVRTREKPVLDGELGYMVQVAVVMANQAFRENRVKFFDPKTEKVS